MTHHQLFLMVLPIGEPCNVVQQGTNIAHSVHTTVLSAGFLFSFLTLKFKPLSSESLCIPSTFKSQHRLPFSFLILLYPDSGGDFDTARSGRDQTACEPLQTNQIILLTFHIAC